MIDPVRLAQFMLLPGASELVDAFASLPPGEVRESAVSHVQVLARASGWTPPHPFGGSYASAEVVEIAPHPRLKSVQDLRSTSLEGQIVERALKGEKPDAIAWNLNAKAAYVKSVIGKARRAGVTFPGDDAPARTKGPGKGRTKSGEPRKMPAAPIPPPPYWFDDPASPVWENPGLLPSLSEPARGSIAAIGPHDARSFSGMTKAAEKRGISLREYLDYKRMILRRVADGEKPVELATELGVQAFEVYGLLAKCGAGRLQQMLAREAAE
jgi:hypothetical protein